MKPKIGPRKISVKKANSRRELARLEEIPNIGPSIAADLRQLGITLPTDLLGRDPYAMYEDLCQLTGQRHDLCLLDTFIAAVRFMRGEPKKPWWKYTAERKREMAARQSGKD
jgi:hypothetical protein